MGMIYIERWKELKICCIAMIAYLSGLAKIGVIFLEFYL